MLKDIFLKIFNPENEDILFAFRESVGLIDAQGIEKYLRKNEVETVYLFTEKKINPNVKIYLDKLDKVKITVSNNMYQSMKRIENDLKEKKINKVDLNDFGIRPIQRDCC